MNMLNVICPWCGVDNDVEPEDASNDELECHKCDNLLFDEEGALRNVPGDTVRMARWVRGETLVLTQGDIDILDGSRSRKVRIDPYRDVEIKSLYDMYKAL